MWLEGKPSAERHVLQCLVFCFCGCGCGYGVSLVCQGKEEDGTARVLAQSGVCFSARAAYLSSP